jgi:uncharacterized protein YndB with AHSA1/START domain
MSEEMGALRRDGELRAVRFERRYEATPEELWAALTEADRLRGWLAEATIEPRVGGRVVFRWSDSEVAEGDVRVFDPPSTLELVWSEHGHDTVLRFQLEPRDGGTLLVLDHRQLLPESAAGFGAGWHAHLDVLGRLLQGQATAWEEADLEPTMARYERLAARL